MAGGEKKLINGHWFGTAQVAVLRHLAEVSREGKTRTIPEMIGLGFTRKQVESAFTGIGLEITVSDGTKYKLGKATLKMLDAAGV